MSERAPAEPAALAAGLAQALGLPGPQAVLGIRRLSGGASQETWAFRALQPAGAERPLVLRRSPPGAALRGSGNAGLAAEAALIHRVAAAGVPVAAVVAQLQPAHGLGEGFIGEWLDGETLGARVAAAPRPALARQCGQALARIHALALHGLPTLRRTQPAAEVQHLRDWHARHGTVRPVFQLALRWLAEHAPADVAPALVHGDFRNGNLMVDVQSDHGAGRLVGVLDWELAHLGDPMADLGWLGLMPWRFGQAGRPVGGFGDWAALLAGYAEAGGQADVQRLYWWQVLGTLRWGVMCESMGFAWASGAEPVMEKAAIARRASETEIDLLDLLLPQAAWPPPPGHTPLDAAPGPAEALAPALPGAV